MSSGNISMSLIFMCICLMSNFLLSVRGCARWSPVHEGNMRVDYGPWQSSPLDDYVRRPDSHYKFECLKLDKRTGYTIYHLKMTSQKWLNESVVCNPVWQHIVSVIIPDRIDHTDKGFLWIDGGLNTEGPQSPDKNQVLQLLTNIAVVSGTVVTTVNQIPNQPTTFKSDPSGAARIEDSILAWGAKLFFDGMDSDALPWVPMTKAAVRAMDTATTFVEMTTGHKLQYFMVGGSSKRGWAAWLTAAVDNRVVAMASLLFELINIQENLKQHFRSLGGWSFAIKDFQEHLFQRLDDTEYVSQLQGVIDPYAYFDRLTMPSLLISASGDEFLIPDNSNLYFDQLLPPKFLRYVPNSGHALTGHLTSVFDTISAFWMSALQSPTDLPHITWSITATTTGGKLTMTVSREPSRVTVYQAQTVTPGRRDFRMHVLGPNGYPVYNPIMWNSSEPIIVSDLIFETEMVNPPEGFFAACLMEAAFPQETGPEIIFTTQIFILPDTMPFADCLGAECKGTLV